MVRTPDGFREIRVGAIQVNPTATSDDPIGDAEAYEAAPGCYVFATGAQASDGRLLVLAHYPTRDEAAAFVASLPDRDLEAWDVRALAGENAAERHPAADLLGVAEVAALLGWSSAQVSARLRDGFGHLPAPLVTLKCGPVWRRADIERWAAERKR